MPNPWHRDDVPEQSQESAERRWFYANYRQGQGHNGATYALAKADAHTWVIEVIVANGRRYRLCAVPEYEAALRIQDYCCARDTATKLALAELYEHSNPEPIERLLEAAQEFGELPRRRMRLQIEVEVELRGTDEEIQSYTLMSLRAATHVKGARMLGMSGPRIEEPTR